MVKMKTVCSFMISSLVAAIFLPTVFSCIFKQSKVKTYSGLWDHKDYKRDQKVYSNCDCGLVYPKTPEPDRSFILYVHSVNQTAPGPKHVTLCTGTIIASNLVATSHWCLTLPYKKIEVYDAWRPPPMRTESMNVVTPDMVTLSTSRELGAMGSNEYTVKDIILNPRFSLNLFTDSYRDDDLALLVTDENLFDQGHNSICLPARSEIDNLQVTHHTGYFYDIGFDHVKSPIMDIVSDDFKTVILSGKECDEERGVYVISSERILCVRYTGVQSDTTGGPLIVTSTSGNKASFLVGIATDVNYKVDNAAYRYTYFFSVIEMVKYIEYYGFKKQSLWCKSSKLKLDTKLKKSPKLNPHPWTDANLLKNRDESLDCLCGVQHGARKRRSASGRISGGEDAKAYEFPWMARLWVTYDNWETDRVCGATIINDRMLLTAAHCVLKLDEDDPSLPEIEVQDATVEVAVHDEDNDPNSVIHEVAHIHFHPAYVPSNRRGKYDSDIALLVLKTPLQFIVSTSGMNTKPKDIRPICLPKRTQLLQLPRGQDAWVIGWGFTDPDKENTFPTALKKLKVPILTNQECAAISESAKNRMTENVMCAGYLDRNKDHQKGDSGGPLMVENAGLWNEVGVVSFGAHAYDDNDNIVKTLGAYANVQKLINFVDFWAAKEGAKWCRSTK